ncbi:hypothetical protein [Methylobacterium gregans]|uniref:hypothetical protein n=1 Tax=Methylobacterium gregans TaxID=374424 RepID=UPI00360AC9E5
MPKTLPSGPALPPAVLRAEPTVWRNPHRRSSAAVLPDLALAEADMRAAAARWHRFAPLLARLFDGLDGGRIDSPLTALPPAVAESMLPGAPGAVWVKADHDLPVTGCIKGAAASTRFWPMPSGSRRRPACCGRAPRTRISPRSPSATSSPGTRSRSAARAISASASA